jgi:putative transposase
VRAGLVERAEDWRWSSARAHLGLGDDGLADPAPLRERIRDWRALLDGGLGEEERESIRAGERMGRMGRLA